MPRATPHLAVAQHGQAISHASSSSSQFTTLSSPSASTLALLSLTQDITALVSLSVEATASLVHDWFRSSLLSVGIGRGLVVSYGESSAGKSKAWGEAGRGLAVVVVGASEPTGQSLCLHLAKSGYTVFPLLPLPSPASPPTSHALSALLLTWSTAQKRLRVRYPHHPGSIVPIMTDPESRSPRWNTRGRTDRRRDSRGAGSFAHAGETVRAYIRENGLKLCAVVCASRSESQVGDPDGGDGGDESTSEDGHGIADGWRTESPDMQMIEDYAERTDSVGTQVDGDDSWAERQQHTTHSAAIVPTNDPPRRGQQRHWSMRSTSSSPEAVRTPKPTAGLLDSEEATLLSLYRSNVLDPLLVIRELQDLLVSPDGTGGKGRVVFVNGPAVFLNHHADEAESPRAAGAARIITAARGETTRLLRAELSEAGVEVCEVAVGPMAPRIGSPGCHFRHRSEDSTGTVGSSDKDRLKLIKDVLHTNQQESGPSQAVTHPTQRDRLLASRLALLQQLWAVDDALLYSSVRRAIEDRYPRATHHAGISPLVVRVIGAVPGAGLMKAVGRWVLGRLLMPRST